MENSLLTGFLFPKIIAENNNLKDQNDFILKSFLIDKVSTNKSFSMVFQLLTAKNAETIEKATVVATPVVPATPIPPHTPSTPSGGEPKDTDNGTADPKGDTGDNTGNSNCEPKGDTADQNTGSEVKKIVEEIEALKTSIGNHVKEIKTQLIPIDSFDKNLNEIKTHVTKPTDTTVESKIDEISKKLTPISGVDKQLQEINEKVNRSFDSFENNDLTAFFEKEKIDFKDFNNSMHIRQLEETIENVCSEKFISNLQKIKASKAKKAKTIKDRAHKFEKLLDEEFLKKIHTTLEINSISHQDFTVFFINILSPLGSLINDIKYFDFDAPTPVTPKETVTVSKTNKTKITT